jgi:hypothetical protein
MLLLILVFEPLAFRFTAKHHILLDHEELCQVVLRIYIYVNDKAIASCRELVTLRV